MRYVKESKYDLYFFIGVVGFLLFINFVVPFFHELGHIMALEYYDCKYWSNLEYGFFNQFYGEIYQQCNLSPMGQSIVYLGGILLTFIIGIILLFIEYFTHKKHKIESAIPILFIAYAFLLDAINYMFFPIGDIKEALSLFNPSAIKYFPLLGILFIVLLITYLYISLHKEIDVLVMQEEHLIKRIKNYIKRKLRRKHLFT